MAKDDTPPAACVDPSGVALGRALAIARRRRRVRLALALAAPAVVPALVVGVTALAR
jgi:hypothetical protein